MLLFKQKNVEQGDDLDDFAVGDLGIGIQTHFHKDMFMKFGGNAVCMDRWDKHNATFIWLQY